MIELVILDSRNFNVKDYTFTKSYTIIFDSLVENNTIFMVNKPNLNASSNDIIITRGAPKQYIGIIDKLNTVNNVTTITCVQFSSKFNTTYVGESVTDVNLGEYIKKIITNNLKNSDDNLQNLDYLEIENKAQITGAVSLTSNAASNILDVINTILKGYELVINYGIEYSTSGGFESLKVTIEDVSNEIVINSKEKFIQNVEVVDGRIGAVNKLIYYPNSDNVLYKTTYSYYLLDDGTITTDSNAEGRLIPVVSEIGYYQDKDIYYDAGETLMAKVRTKFAETTYNHYIKFTINENKAIPINSLNLGDRVLFIDEKNQKYNSIVTQLYYNDVTGNVQVQLGLNRITLTDKLLMGGK